MAKLTEELISQWHPTKNGDRSPTEPTMVKTIVWWLGKCGHEWDASIFSRTQGAGCPFCSGKRILIGFNDLASDNPELSKEWHPTKNGNLTPFIVTAHSSRKNIWWQCKLGHEWICAVSERNGSKTSGCPTCSGNRILPGFNDLRTLNPELAAEWHPTMNGTLTPDTISPGTHESAFWLGKVCGHTWPAQVKARHLSGNGCHFCSGHKVLAGFNDLASQSPRVATEWHPTMNGSLTPQEVSNGAHENAFWLCAKGHEWPAVIGARTSNGNNCPYCSNRKILIGYNDLATTHPLVAAEWHPILNGDFTPFMAGAGMNRKSVHWLCKKGHDWYASIGHRSRGIGCPTCSNYRILTGYNDLATKNPELLVEWHPTKNLKFDPTKIGAGTDATINWICSKGHEWKAKVLNRAIMGQNCPKCSNQVSKPEKVILAFLENAGFSVEQSNRKLLGGKEIDLYLPENDFAIEFNGVYWHTEERGKGETYHYDKWLDCKNQGVELVQIWEDDWMRNKEIILKNLLQKLVPNVKKATVVKAVKVISDTLAQKFITTNSAQIFTNADVYVGSFDSKDILSSVVSLNITKESVTIVSFATKPQSMNSFGNIVDFIASTYPEATVTFVDDNCFSFSNVLEEHNFVATDTVKPDFMLVSKRERLPVSSMLAMNEKLPRIWDAGKTIYIY